MLSVAVNAVLAVMFVLLIDGIRESDSSIGVRISKKSKAPPQSKTNVVVRRQHFSWNEVESDDYRTYINNLKKIGCPENTIRDIILAEVTHFFEQRKATEIRTPEQQWWKSEPDMDLLQSVADQIRKLEAEKRTFLTELLGPGWEPQVASINPTLVRFDGAVLSQLTMEQKRAILQIEDDSSQRFAAAMAQRSDPKQPLDPAEMARLRSTTRAELAKILPPQALEEYLLRYSATAENMRQELRGFSASPEEFRSIFRIRDNYEQQLAALGNGTDQATERRRQELERAREQAITSALGNERAPLYVASQDPAFQAAQQRVEQSGGAPEQVIPIYEIERLSRAEVARISNDSSLSEEEREVAIRQVEKLQQSSIEKLLTPPSP